MITDKEIQEWKNKILSSPENIKEENEVITRFGRLFHPRNIPNLTKEDFKSFLILKNNRHWSGIHRQGNMITKDMPKLQQTLTILLNEKEDLKKRLDKLFPKNKPSMIRGLGRAIVTPILMMVYPDKYGVFNTKTETGLQILNLFPQFKNQTFSEKYIQINKILQDFSKKHGLTLWQTDYILGLIAIDLDPNEMIQSDPNQYIAYKAAIKPNVNDIIQDDLDDTANNIEDLEESRADFGLEKHLEDFLVENWEKTDLGKKYDIIEEDGDLRGQQYPTGVGRIDILAKSKDDKEWIVIELKKGRSSDAVVGQTLRYIGWIKENKATKDQKVRGLIILGTNTDKLKYSISTLSNVEVMTYEVKFSLKEG